MARRAILLILDGVGIGEAHDARQYGDVGSHTLGHVLAATPNASLPSLDELRAKIVGLVQAPATKIAQVVNAPAAKLARVFGAYAKTGDAQTDEAA